MKKATTKEIADRIIRDGVIIQNTDWFIVVEAFGQRYRIERPFTKHPKIQQIGSGER